MPRWYNGEPEPAEVVQMIVRLDPAPLLRGLLVAEDDRGLTVRVVPGEHHLHYRESVGTPRFWFASRARRPGSLKIGSAATSTVNRKTVKTLPDFQWQVSAFGLSEGQTNIMALEAGGALSEQIAQALPVSGSSSIGPPRTFIPTPPPLPQ